MSACLTHYNINCQGLVSVSSFGGNSLPICLVVGLIEVCGLHSGNSLTKHVDYIIKQLDALIQVSISSFPAFNTHLQYLSSIFNYIVNQKPAKKALLDLDGIINNQQTLEYIYIASKALIGGMMIKKLKSANEEAKLENFLADEDYKDMNANILLYFCNMFLVNIQEYENNQSQGMAKPDKSGVFPVIHILKHEFRYYLAKTKEMSELKSEQMFNPNLIEDMPFVYGKAKKKCPINHPMKIAPVLNYGDDLAVLKLIIEKMTEELKAKGGFSSELSAFIKECQSQNNYVRTLTCLVDSPLICSSCRSPLGLNNYSDTNHKNCAVCDTCMAKANGICPKCRGRLSESDRSLLGI